MLTHPMSMWDFSLSPAGTDVFDRFHDRVRRLFGTMEPAFAAASYEPTAYPPIRAWEDADHLYVEAEVAGFGPEDVEILVQGEELSIKGRRAEPDWADKVTWHRRDPAVGEFARVFALPHPVNPDAVEARFLNGLLRIRMAKPDAVKPKRIPVLPASSSEAKAITGSQS